MSTYNAVSGVPALVSAAALKAGNDSSSGITHEVISESLKRRLFFLRKAASLRRWDEKTNDSATDLVPTSCAWQALIIA